MLKILSSNVLQNILLITLFIYVILTDFGQSSEYLAPNEDSQIISSLNPSDSIQSTTTLLISSTEFKTLMQNTIRQSVRDELSLLKQDHLTYSGVSQVDPDDNVNIVGNNLSNKTSIETQGIFIEAESLTQSAINSGVISAETGHDLREKIQSLSQDQADQIMSLVFNAYNRGDIDIHSLDAFL